MIMQDMKHARGLLSYVVRAVEQGVLKVLGGFLGFGAIGFGAVIGGSFLFISHNLSRLSFIAGAVFAVALGYAGALTIAVTEGVKAIAEGSREILQEGEKLEETVVSDAKTIENNLIHKSTEKSSVKK